MFKFFIKYRLQISIVAVILGLFLLMIQSHSNRETSHLQSAIQTFTYPIQASVHSFASSDLGWILLLFMFVMYLYQIYHYSLKLILIN